MIKFVSNWAEQIIVVIVIATIIEMILPENSNKKYIKLVIGIYILFTIISPFIKRNMQIEFDNMDFNKNNSEISQEIVNQESMDLRLKKLYEEQIQNDIVKKVEKEGYIVKKCDVDIDLNSQNKGINKIVLIIKKSENNSASLNEKVEKIDKVEIKVGINKYIKSKENNEDINDLEINKLKNTLSNYYQIDQNNINITKD